MRRRPRPSSEPEDPATKAVAFSHSGVTYLLGYGPDFFAIWDRGQPDGPVERFPRTDAGWEQAWWRYIAIEDHFAEITTNPIPIPKGPAWTRAPEKVVDRARSGWRTAAAWTGTIFGFVLLVIPGLFALRSLRRWQQGRKRRPLLPWALAIVCLAAMGSCEAAVGFVIQQCIVDQSFDLRANACHEANGRDLDPTDVRFISEGSWLIDEHFYETGTWPTGSTAGGSITQGKGTYQVLSRRPDRGLWAAVVTPGGPFTGLIVEVEAVVVGPPAAFGVLCFGEATDDFYAFVLAPAERYYAIMAFRDGEADVLAERRLYTGFPLAISAPDKIRGDCQVNSDGSSTATLSVWGFSILEYRDRSARYEGFRGGGVIVGGPGPSAEAEFTHVLIARE